MSKLINSLKGLIRRVSKKMEVMFLTIGVLAVTISFSVVSVTEDIYLKNFCIVLAIFGIVLCVFAFIITNKKESKELNKNIYDIHSTNRIITLLEEMGTNIKDLVDEIRKDRNERDKSNSTSDEKRS